MAMTCGIQKSKADKQLPAIAHILHEHEPRPRAWLRQVPEEDMRRVAAATGARVQTTVSKLQPAVLGTCAKFEEVQARACATHEGASRTFVFFWTAILYQLTVRVSFGSCPHV